MSITLKRGLALVATLATVGAVAVFPTIVGAEDHSLTVTPSTITVGESADFIATGCVDEVTPQDDLTVVFYIDGEFYGFEFTDGFGTATTSLDPVGVEDVGEYVITARCRVYGGEFLFDYDPATLTVTPPPLTVTPSTIEVGQSTDFIATGCASEDIETESLVVEFYIDGEFFEEVWIEEGGTATIPFGPADLGDVGEYEIGATCIYFISEEGWFEVFDYDPATLTVVDVSPTTTTTTTAPAAAKSTLTFTG